MPESAMAINSSLTRPKLCLIIPKTRATSTIEESDSSSERSTPSIDLDSDGSELNLTISKNVNLQRGDYEKPLLNKMFNSDDSDSFYSSSEYETSVSSDSSVASTANCEKINDLDNDFQNTSSVSKEVDDVTEQMLNLQLPASDSHKETVLSSACRKSNRTQEEVDNFRNEYSNNNLKNVNSSCKNVKMNYINVFDKNNDTLSDTENVDSQEDLTSDNDDDDLVQRGPMNRKSHISSYKPYNTLIDIDTSEIDNETKEIWKNAHFRTFFEALLERMHNSPESNSADKNKSIKSDVNFQISNSPSPDNSWTTNVILNTSLQVMPDITVSQGPQSTSSSNNSYINTPSPSDYPSIVNSPTVEPLGTEFDQSEIYSKLDGTSKDIINKEDTINKDDPDSQHFSLLPTYGTEIADTYPRSSSDNEHSNAINNTYTPCEFGNCMDDKKNRMSNVLQNPLMYLVEHSFDLTQLTGPIEKTQSDLSEGRFQLTTENVPTVVISSPDIRNGSSNPISSNNNNFLPVCENIWSDVKQESATNTDLIVLCGQQLTPNSSPASSTTSTSTVFVDFPVPKIPTTVRTQCKRRTVPWPSLNLPSTAASKRLKEGLDPEDVNEAMRKLLLKSRNDLTRVDNDGYTQLMRLVKNSNELKNKRIRAYLIPLVERIGDIHDSLSATNNYGEDALYLAAMSCHEMAYVPGYLAAAMIKRHIGISQKLYHNRGDTLIHAVAAKGDTHIRVLSELLDLKTNEGNCVFDLSKCNYDGKTALHMAVEAHNTSEPRISSIGTVQLLLKHGVDPKVKETMCGNTALHLAVCLSCDPSLIKALLSYKGYEAVNSMNNNDNTPVHMAAMSHVFTESQMEVCRYLILHGGLTNIQNQQGKTALDLVSPDRHEMIEMIFHKIM